MDTRTQTIPIYSDDSVHQQVLAYEACGVRSTAFFGVLPRRDEIRVMLGMTFETTSRLVSVVRHEGVLALTPGRNALLDRVALRAALLAEGVALSIGKRG